MEQSDVTGEHQRASLLQGRRGRRVGLNRTVDKWGGWRRPDKWATAGCQQKVDHSEGP